MNTQDLELPVQGIHLVYLLHRLNPSDAPIHPTRRKYRIGQTYIGYSNHLRRRIRQHMGEIKGGAKYTKRWIQSRQSFELVLYVTGFQSNRDALSFEWHAKRVHGIHKRIQHIQHLIESNHRPGWHQLTIHYCNSLISQTS